MVIAHPYTDDQKIKRLNEHIQRIKREHSPHKLKSQLYHELQKLMKVDSTLEVAEQLPVGYKNVEGITTLEDLLNMDFSGSTFLIDNLIVAEALNILGGSSDCGKSTLAFQICIAICCKNDKFLGLKINAKCNSVLYVPTEDNLRQIWTRTTRQLADATNNKNAFSCFGVVNDPSDAIAKIERGLLQQPADLVVIDNILDLFSGDLNSATEVRIFMNKLQELINKYHCAVLLIHHTGKANEKNQTKASLLGSQAFEAKPRQAIMLKRVPESMDLRKLEIVKGNYVADAIKKEGILLRFNPDTLTFSLVDEKVAETEMQQLPRYDVKPDIAAFRYDVKPDRPPRQRKTHKTLQREAKMKRAYEMNWEGKTLEEIATVFAVDKSTVCRWLKKMQR